jgi:uncharacterized protein YjiS (DUF1127 family)
MKRFLEPAMGLRLLSGFRDWGARIRRFGTALVARHRAVAEIQQLYHCTDMELRDIGLNRGDLPAIAKGTYRRD